MKHFKPAILALALTTALAATKKRLFSRNFGNAHKVQDFQNTSKDGSVYRKESC